MLDVLSRLVDKSLVVNEEDEHGQGRYRLLETVRQYGRERLRERGEAQSFRGRHLSHFLSLAEEAKEKIQGPEQAAWLEILETEHDNLRAALEWCLEEKEAQAGLRLAGALERFWGVRGHLSEGRKRLLAALSVPGAEEPTQARAAALSAAGLLAWRQGDFEQARSHHEEALALRKQRRDTRGIAASLGCLGLVAAEQGDYVAARALYQEALALNRQMGDRAGEAANLNSLGIVAMEQGHYEEALSLYEQALALHRERVDQLWVAITLHNLGVLARRQGDYARAQALAEEALHLNRELGNRHWEAGNLHLLGHIAEHQGEYVAARSLYEQSLSIFRQIGVKEGAAWALLHLGRLSVKERNASEAAPVLRESLLLARQIQSKLLHLETLAAFAALAELQEQPQRSARLWGAEETLRKGLGVPLSAREHEEREVSLARLRALLGQDAFAAAFAEGQRMPLEEALEVALQEQESR